MRVSITKARMLNTQAYVRYLSEVADIPGLSAGRRPYHLMNMYLPEANFSLSLWPSANSKSVNSSPVNLTSRRLSKPSLRGLLTAFRSIGFQALCEYSSQVVQETLFSCLSFSRETLRTLNISSLLLRRLEVPSNDSSQAESPEKC